MVALVVRRYAMMSEPYAFSHREAMDFRLILILAILTKQEETTPKYCLGLTLRGGLT